MGAYRQLMPDFVICESTLNPNPGDRARVLCVMTPEIDRLIQRLHVPDVLDMAAVWAEHRCSLV
jgi:hypothetical protein